MMRELWAKHGFVHDVRLRHDIMPHIMPRKRISDTLHEALLAYPLVVLTAPVSYGKTTVAREIMRNCLLTAPSHADASAKNKPSGRVFHHCYYSLISPGENTATYLWNRQCFQLAAQGSPLAERLLNRPFPSDPVQRDSLHDLAREVLSETPTLMIIDDYHNADCPEFDYYIETLVRWKLPNSSILLLSRTRPGLALDELRTKGMCAVFDQDLLAFSEDDTVSYYRLHGIADDEAARSAWKVSEGWIAALWFGMQSYRHTGAALPVAEVHDLLDHVVFSRFDAGERRLLMQLSILDDFSPRQAIAVTGDENAGLRLKRLYHNNAFLRYMPKTDSYRMHGMFRSFCLARLEIVPDSEYETPVLYRRAGEWMVRSGAFIQAIRAFSRAGRDEDMVRILDVFEQHGTRLPLTGDTTELIWIVMSIPWKLRCMNPLGYVAFALYYGTRISTHGGERLLDEAEKIFAETGFSEERRREAQGEISLARAQIFAGDYRTFFDCVSRARLLLDGPSRLVDQDRIWTYGCPHAGFLYLREAGDYARLEETFRNELGGYLALSNGCGVGGAALVEAERYLETGKPDRAELAARQAISEAETRKQTSVIIAAHFCLARHAVLQGQGRKALDRLRDIGARTGAPHPLFAVTLDLCSAYIGACLNREDAIPDWVRQGRIDPERMMRQSMAFAYIVHGKTLLLEKEYLRLAILARAMRNVHLPCGNLFGFLHAHIFEAIAAFHLSGMEEALECLRHAVELARADNLVLLFAEYSEHLVPVLHAFAACNPHDAFCSELVRQTDSYARIVGSAIKRQSLPIRLTPREQQMLDLVIQGKSNPEIAASLGIKRITVTKTLGHVYRKLGVDNRIQAMRLYFDMEA